MSSCWCGSSEWLPRHLTSTQNYEPSGYGHEPVAGVSRVRDLMPLKTDRVEELMHGNLVPSPRAGIIFSEAPFRRYQLPQVILTPSVLPRGKAPELCRCKICSLKFNFAEIL
ncbi:hypothetical protein TNCV_4141251 [Trichonephila clavipes]|nr:hypothetical protein TNCV_4141251 [Trichonephila clavipes]